jgi:hypothetical protein
MLSSFFMPEPSAVGFAPFKTRQVRSLFQRSSMRFEEAAGKQKLVPINKNFARESGESGPLQGAIWGAAGKGPICPAATITKWTRLPSNGHYEWHLADVQRLDHPRKPKWMPQPVWFKPF